MHLDAIDWVIIAAYLVISLVIGIALKGKASGSLSDFFLGGRSLPWYIAGISMVATTFAADTPLLVTELVAENGVSGNWLWWNMLIGGMLTTFFFARLWRRANVLTELEFIELRYSGIGAALLRGFKSIYMGIFLNAVIIGWVNAALMTILHVFFDIPESELLWYVAGMMVLVALYSSLSGLLGVAITDTIQFTIAMIGCIILAFIVLNNEKVGGIEGLKSQLPAWRFDLFPSLDRGGSIGDIASKFSITIGAFLAYGMVQWWASWYPGNEPGGGGYISQRMMSAKTEKDSLFATLLFQIAHYCLRPWPWIIVALASLVLFPELPPEKSGHGFVLIMRDYLPTGLKGMLLVAFLAAYMSTISTQLNWGASCLTNDLYKRFLKPNESEKHYVGTARLFTVLIMVIGLIATTQIKTIEGAVHFLIECGAGLGLVLILRWYWWRINAWSEIAATLAPFVGYSVSRWALGLEFPNSFFCTVGFTTLVWTVVTYTTPTDPKEHLQAFFDRVKPGGIWGEFNNGTSKMRIGPLLLAWISALGMTYSLLFATGKLIFMEWSSGFTWLGIAIACLALLLLALRSGRVLQDS